LNKAAKGRRFEYDIQHLLESVGYSVMRGASSKGDFFGEKVDLIATRFSAQTEYTVYVYGLQCKAKKVS
jgi:Holliday junction resolvase